MISPIVEYGRSGDITNIIALSRVQGNPGWTDHPQNLVENARRFEKEILRPGGDANIQVQKNIDWTAEMKIKLLKIDNEERSKGRGFMERVKQRWDLNKQVLVCITLETMHLVFKKNRR